MGRGGTQKAPPGETESPAWPQPKGPRAGGLILGPQGLGGQTSGPSVGVPKIPLFGGGHRGYRGHESRGTRGQGRGVAQNTGGPVPPKNFAGLRRESGGSNTTRGGPPKIWGAMRKEIKRRLCVETPGPLATKHLGGPRVRGRSNPQSGSTGGTKEPTN